MRNISKLSRVDLLTWLFVIFTLLTILARFSLYNIPGIATACMLLLVVVFIAKIGNRKGILFKKNALIFGVSWSVIYLLGFIINYSVPGFGLMTSLLYGFMFLCLDDIYQNKIFTTFAWIFAVLLALSIIEYIIFQVFGYGAVLGYVSRETNYKSSYFAQLLFNVVRADLALQRFQGLANEPGLMGTLCGFLLFASWKSSDLRIPYYIFLIAGILSFSLAFYIILIAHLFGVLRLNIKYIFMILIISLITFYFLRDSVEVLLIERVADTEEIDNRTSEAFDMEFRKSYDNGSLWFGVGSDNFFKYVNAEEGANAGGKLWIFQYGIISFIILFFVYNYLFIQQYKRKLELFDWLFLVTFWLSFYQRQTIYAPYTLICFLSFPLQNKLLRK